MLYFSLRLQTKQASMKNLKNSIYFKLGMITILILLLLIPTAMVKDLIREREYIKARAIEEVSEKWGQSQTLTGPFISIPFDRYVKQIDQNKQEKIVKVKDWIHVLPHDLNIEGDISPEKRYRGIYEVVVYESNIEMSGTFQDMNIASLGIEKEHIHFDQATINIGITDLKGIEQQVELLWEGRKVLFNSGLSTSDVAESGINASVDLSESENKVLKFSAKLLLNGSQAIQFIPLGKTTDVNLKSNWSTPSFSGAYLPDHRSINEGSFESNWNVLHLNRNYPQQWTGAAHQVWSSAFGVDLLLPVDSYKKADRVSKYAVLFIVLTFLVFFFVEVLNKVFIHPIQYLLVGLALILFYTLLLSFSEHLLFNLAYGLAAILTIVLVSFYAIAILKSRMLGGLVFGILFILYSFIFTIIQLEDYALLIGSIGMFIILSIVMYFSRKIDWYNLKLGNNE